MKIGNIHNHLFSLVHIFIKNQKDVLTNVLTETLLQIILNLYIYIDMYICHFICM